MDTFSEPEFPGRPGWKHCRSDGWTGAGIGWRRGAWSENGVVLPAGSDGGLVERIEAREEEGQPGQLSSPDRDGTTGRGRGFLRKYLGGFGADGLSELRLQSEGCGGLDRDCGGARRNFIERGGGKHIPHSDQ